ncbi:mercury(II) reductase [Cupriavidus metallidurans]|uniref:mercury(II) reductase n=1 Tax=Cupriavidus metallidurans TaxID=119219 RepID=UPI0035C71E66
MNACCVVPGGGSEPRAYDLAVIGAGSAGFSAAITAANEGARVVLIGHGRIGGTCVNFGCVPSKTLLRAAEAVHAAQSVARFPGLAGTARLTDWSTLMGAKDELVATLRREKYADPLSSYETIDYIDGPARLADGGLTIGGAPLLAGKFVIATGAAPALPDIPGISDVPILTSTSALELPERPESLLVVGGGYIGCELAQLFARLGSKVTLVTRGRLLPETEPELSAALTGYLRDEGISVWTGLGYRDIRQTGEGVALSVDVEGRIENLAAGQVLVATGRTPNTDGLGLVEHGVALDERGAIIVDDHMRTSRFGVYAAGDVTNRDAFVYMAAHGAKVAARNALNGDGATYDNRAMPWVVFTDPQVVGVGLTEAIARATDHEVKTSIVNLDQVPRALAARDTRGLIKLVADARTDVLLGGQILAPEGADAIQSLALAIRHGMTAAALAETIFPYLTTVEGLKLAALGFHTNVARLSCCAG